MENEIVWCYSGGCLIHIHSERNMCKRNKFVSNENKIRRDMDNTRPKIAWTLPNGIALSSPMLGSNGFGILINFLLQLTNGKTEGKIH